jgi:hypothetical protein
MHVYVFFLLNILIIIAIKKRTKKIYMKENIWNNKKKELQIINVFLTNSSDVLSASFSSSSSFSIVPDRFTSVS